MVKHVIVNGWTVVEDGRVVAWDEAELLARVRASTARAWSRFPDYHHGPEPIDAAYPPAFPAWEADRSKQS